MSTTAPTFGKPPPYLAKLPGVKPSQATQELGKASHNIFVGIVGELIGVAALAIFADMNDDLGKIIVTLMVGWFILFLTLNANAIAPVVKKV